MGDKIYQLRKERRKAGSVLVDVLIKVSSPLVVLASAVLVVFVFLLAYYLPLNEKEALIRKTDDFCISVAVGLSSTAIEEITYNKKGIINDYLIDVAGHKIQGLAYADVVQYQWRKVKDGTKIPDGGKIIASLRTKDVGKTITRDELESLTKVESFRKKVVAGKTGNMLEYAYPVVWKVKHKGKKQDLLLGAVRLKFSEKEILQSYYTFRDFSNQVAGAAAVSTVIIVYFYLVLVRMLKRKIREINEMSTTDSLTKIHNRKKFEEVLNREIHRFKRYKQKLSVIMFDIDHFKKVNDTYGHDVGDLVLVTVAQIVQRAVRNTDLLARWGGEEFMILATNTDCGETGHFAERIRQDIEKFDFDIVEKVTCSFGVAAYREKDTPESFLKRADDALYRSKENGRNRVTLEN